MLSLDYIYVYIYIITYFFLDIYLFISTSKVNFVIIPADFCGTPKWWFRNPSAAASQSTALSSVDACDDDFKMNVKVTFYMDNTLTKMDNRQFYSSCEVDLMKSFDTYFRNVQ